MSLVDVASETDDCAARVAAPVGGEQAGEGGDEVDAAIVADRLRHILDLGRALDQPEVVAEPLDERAADRNRALEGVDGRLIAELVADSRQQAALRGHQLRAGVVDHEAAGAIRILGLADAEADLAHRGRLLIAEDAGHRHAIQRATLDVTVGLAARSNLGQHLTRHTDRLQQVVVPIQRLEVHQHRARRVGHVGDVDAAIRPAGEPPGHERVDVAEERIAGLGLLQRAGDVVEDPAHLRAGEVGGQRQTRLVAEAILAAIPGELVDDMVGASVLPDDGVVERLAGAPVPDDGRLTLVGDADRGDILLADKTLGERALDDCLRVMPDLARAVFDPARLWVDLLVLHLLNGNDVAGVVEDHAARARRPLVDRRDVLLVGHMVPPLRCFPNAIGRADANRPRAQRPRHAVVARAPWAAAASASRGSRRRTRRPRRRVAGQ